MTEILTRKQYLAGEVEHELYYGQFVTPTLTATVVALVGADTLRASTCPHQSDIPLAVWDRLTGYPRGRSMLTVSREKLKAAGETLTFSTLLCIAKEAARQWKEQA